MQTSAPGSDTQAHTRIARGFTLLELLVVVAIMALATAGVSLAMRDASDTQLEREAQRLAALLESGRAQARMASVVVRWRSTTTAFTFEGLPGTPLPAQWLGTDVRTAEPVSLVLGPEPIIGPQQVRLVSIANPNHSLVLGTDGIRPFAVVLDRAAAAGTP